MPVQYNLELDNEYSNVSLLTNDTLIIVPDPTNVANSVDRLIVTLHQGTGSGIVTNITWQATNDILWKDNNTPDSFDGNVTIDQIYHVELWKNEFGPNSWLGKFYHYLPPPPSGGGGGGGGGGGAP